jgi:hypothetical protein
MYMQREEVLSTHEVKYTGRWDSSIAPSVRSSLMKYLKKEAKEKCYTNVVQMIWELEIKEI